MSEVIYVHIYEPHKPSLFGKGKKTEKSQLHVYTCDNCTDCDAYKKGQCINVGNVFGARCPIGKKSVSNGYTPRANAYYDQIRGWKEKYKDTYHKLDSAPKRITKVPTGWMLPYSYMAMNESVPFKSKESLFSGGCPFLLDEDMNADVISSILSFRPQAMMGGEIKSYQQESVAKFIKDFSDNYPDEFNNVASGIERVNLILESYDYKGRKAYLKTVKAGVRVKVSKNDYWDWDGEKIYKEDVKFMIFQPVSWSGCYASFTPDDKATIEITDNNQVTVDTKFAD